MASDFTIPKPLGYWEPPMDVVDFEEQLQKTPLELSPVDDPKMPNSTPPIGKKIIQNSTGGDREGGLAGKGMTRDMTNNFGYMSKPGWMGATSMIPGPLGLAAKAANLGINANNQQATSDARKTLGLPEQSNWDTAKGIARDNKGLVSKNVSINEHNYPVGFEAMTPDNRTTLTPNEALTRSNLLGGLKETPAPESAVKDSPFSGIFDEASSFLSSIFGEETGANRPATNSLTPQGMMRFPDAPKADTKKAEANPNKVAGPWGAAGNIGEGKTGYGHEGKSGQSVGPSGGGKSWGGPH